MNVEIFVQNVKKLCKAAGTNPTAACEASGAGRNFMDNVKKGSTPSVTKVQKLADYLGVTTSELLGEISPAGPRDNKTPATVSGDGQAEKLAKALEGIGIDVDKLSDAEISRIARLAKAALEE